MEQIQLYVWPGQWNLPSFDPLCVAAVLYLQLAIPGKFCIVECIETGLSPTGQLPFLAHDHTTVTSFTAIVKYIEGLKTSDKSFANTKIDEFSSSVDKAKRAAWTAHIVTNMGNLVYHTLFSAQHNWEGLTHPALVSMMPIPQKYYLPRGIRAAYISRLETAGLWNDPRPFPEMQTDTRKFTAKKEFKPTSLTFATSAFEKEKILNKVQDILDVYSRLLGDRLFLFSESVSSTDILFGAHLLLLLEPPYPNAQIPTFMCEKYVSLVSYARRIQQCAWHQDLPKPRQSTTNAFKALIPREAWFTRRSAATIRSPEDIHYDKLRRGFIGLSLASIAAYVVLTGMIVFSFSSDENDDEEDEAE